MKSDRRGSDTSEISRKCREKKASSIAIISRRDCRGVSAVLPEPVCPYAKMHTL